MSYSCEDINFPVIQEIPEGPLPRSQLPTAGPCPELDEPSAHPHLTSLRSVLVLS